MKAQLVSLAVAATAALALAAGASASPAKPVDSFRAIAPGATAGWTSVRPGASAGWTSIRPHGSTWSGIHILGRKVGGDPL